MRINAQLEYEKSEELFITKGFPKPKGNIIAIVILAIFIVALAGVIALFVITKMDGYIGAVILFCGCIAGLIALIFYIARRIAESIKPHLIICKNEIIIYHKKEYKYFLFEEIGQIEISSSVAYDDDATGGREYWELSGGHVEITVEKESYTICISNRESAKNELNKYFDNIIIR